MKTSAAKHTVAHEEERLRAALRIAGGGVWNWDFTTGQAWWSNEMYDLYGVEPGTTMLLDNSLACVFVDDRQAVKDAVAEAIAADSTFQCDFRVDHPTRGMRWMWSFGQLFRSETGQPQRLIGMTLDITQRKLAEERLLNSEQRLGAVVSNAPHVAIQWYDADGRVVLWNEASEAMFGYTSDEALGRTLDELICTPEETAEFRASLALVEATGTSIGPSEYGFRRRNGELATCLSSLFPIPGDGGRLWFASMDIDITARKQAEEALAKSHAQLRTFFSQTINGCFFMMLDEPIVWDDSVDRERTLDYIFAHQRVTQINNAMLEQYGTTREQMLGMTPNDLFSHNLAHGRELWRKMLDAGKVRLESDERKADGTQMWIEGEYILLHDEVGRITGHFGVQRDISERVATEQALRESEERYKTIFHNAPDALFVIAAHGDNVGRIVAANEQAARMHNTTLDQIVERNIQEFDTPESAAQAPERLRRVAAGERLTFEVEHRLADGSLLPVEVTAGQIVLDGQPHVLAFDRDISDRRRAERAEAERRRLEEQILHAQKLESLGVLAGGIAHDFNNLMTIVLGYASLAQMNLPDDSPVAPMLREIEKGAQRATELTQQMLAYAGKGNFVIQPLQLDTLVSEMHALLHTTVSKQATVQLDLQPATIEGDATQIRQVVMNLITNASDALGGETGIIRISTGVRHAETADLQSRYTPESLPAGNYAFVRIADTGCGMSAETLARIFDPFFTTKFTGRGLGLAGVLGIVRSHRGTIKVESAPGTGTTFEVLVPSTSAPTRAADADDPTTARGQGTVVVIDDEPGVRSFARAALEGAGFRVVLAADGVAGLTACKEHRTHIAAVLLDLTMPNMDGRTLLEHLREIAPQLPVLIMSGFDQDEFAVRFESQASGFIQKPFHPRELIARVTELTSSASP